MAHTVNDTGHHSCSKQYKTTYYIQQERKIAYYHKIKESHASLFLVVNVFSSQIYLRKSLLKQIFSINIAFIYLLFWWRLGTKKEWEKKPAYPLLCSLSLYSNRLTTLWGQRARTRCGLACRQGPVISLRQENIRADNCFEHASKWECELTKASLCMADSYCICVPSGSRIKERSRCDVCTHRVDCPCHDEVLIRWSSQHLSEEVEGWFVSSLSPMIFPLSIYISCKLHHMHMLSQPSSVLLGKQIVVCL